MESWRLYTTRANLGVMCLMEVFCVVKIESAQSKESSDRDSEVTRRRSVLADVYNARGCAVGSAGALCT